jgi:hypothetical protein
VVALMISEHSHSKLACFDVCTKAHCSIINSARRRASYRIRDTLHIEPVGSANICKRGRGRCTPRQLGVVLELVAKSASSQARILALRISRMAIKVMIHSPHTASYIAAIP